jgi:hypothetical protein
MEVEEIVAGGCFMYSIGVTTQDDIVKAELYNSVVMFVGNAVIVAVIAFYPLTFLRSIKIVTIVIVSAMALYVIHQEFLAVQQQQSLVLTAGSFATPLTKLFVGYDIQVTTADFGVYGSRTFSKAFSRGIFTKIRENFLNLILQVVRDLDLGVYSSFATAISGLGAMRVFRMIIMGPVNHCLNTFLKNMILPRIGINPAEHDQSLYQ